MRQAFFEPWQRFRRHGKGLVLLLGHDPRAVAVVARHHDPLLAHEHRAAIGQLAAVFLFDLADDGRTVMLADRIVLIELCQGFDRAFETVVPMDLDGRHVAARRKVPTDDVGKGEPLVAAANLFEHLDAGRAAELQGHEGAVEIMTAPIADRAVAELPPTAPQLRMQFGVIGAVGRRANPLIPMQAGRNRQRGKPAPHAAATRSRPAIGLDHVADRARPDIFAKPANALLAVPLVAELRHHLLLSGSFHHGPHLADAVGQWLLAIDVLAQVHRDRRRHGVMMVGEATNTASTSLWILSNIRR